MPYSSPATRTLVNALARLASARSMPEVVEQLRATARHLVGADGIAVVELRDGRCHYVAEDAQSPLWAGQSFPALTCISGMAMTQGQTIVIPDVRADPRIPQAAYAPTFVRSMAMAPIGADAALGAYWAAVDVPDDRRVEMLEALARVAACAVEDIRHVDAAARSEIQLRGVLDSVSDSYYALDRDWTVVEFSRSAEAYFRLKREDVLGRNIWALFPQGRGGDYEKLLRAAMDDGLSARLESPSDFNPGNTVELRAAPMAGGISVALTDITERRRAEAELRRQTEELQAVLDAAPAAIWVARGTNGDDIRGNRFAREILRVSGETNFSRTTPDAETSVGHFRILDSDGADIPTENLSMYRASRGEIAWGADQHILFDDGEAVHLFGNAVPLLDEHGAPRGAVAVFSDVTHLKKVERELRELTRDLQVRIAAAVSEREAALSQLHEAQKTEALGQIAGGVAHDFNNLLSPILGGLELLRRRGLSDARADRLIDGAIQSAERARTLVQRMLSFARRQPLQPRPVDVRELVENLHSLLASSVGSRVRIVIDVAAHLPPALADANQLELALLNLVVNARDAMPDGGVVTITATTAKPSGARPGAFVEIAVIDTGVGMNEATLKRAVEPFFSTKGIGKGTGLGLSMVHGLAAQLGGAMHIESTLGVGTRIVLQLPVAQHQANDARAEAPPALAPSIGAVLLVDDESIVRESTREMLEDLGYSVVEAASAQEAITILDAGGRFDWVITDHMMPGMTGADLARAVRQRKPAVKVLIVSGYADVDDIAPDLPRLAKPFLQMELAQELAAADRV